MSRMLTKNVTKAAFTTHRVTPIVGLAGRQIPYMSLPLVVRRGFADNDDSSRRQMQSRDPRGVQAKLRRGLPSTRRMMSSPFDIMMEAFENDLNEMFGSRGLPDFLGERPRSVMPRGLEDWVPKVNIAETEKAIHVHAELPGVKKEDIKVEIDEDGMLVIHGERKQELKEEDKEKKYLRMESSFGSFERRIALPEGVSQDNIKAKFQDGVLEVEVQRPSPPQRKTTTVNIE